MQAPTKELMLLWFNTSTCKPTNLDDLKRQSTFGFVFHVIKVKALTTTRLTANNGCFIGKEDARELSVELQERWWTTWGQFRIVGDVLPPVTECL